MNSNSVTRKAVALLILIFVLGIGFGILGTRAFNARVNGAALRPPQPPLQPTPPARVVARINQDLNLNAEQQKQIGDIIGSMQTGYDNIRQQMTPQFDAVREEGRNRIRQTLTPEQRPKFEEYLRKLDEERRKRAVANAAGR